jgi:hypothetical protein
MFWKTFSPSFPVFFPPHISNVDYLDSTTLCNTKITIFNIDMGEGGKNSFQKFLHRIVDLGKGIAWLLSKKYHSQLSSKHLYFEVTTQPAFTWLFSKLLPI